MLSSLFHVLKRQEEVDQQKISRNERIASEYSEISLKVCVNEMKKLYCNSPKHNLSGSVRRNCQIFQCKASA